MTTTEDFFRRSRLYQRLKRGPHEPLVEVYADRILADGKDEGQRKDQPT